MLYMLPMWHDPLMLHALPVLSTLHALPLLHILLMLRVLPILPILYMLSVLLLDRQRQAYSASAGIDSEGPMDA